MHDFQLKNKDNSIYPIGGVSSGTTRDEMWFSERATSYLESINPGTTIHDGQYTVLQVDPDGVYASYHGNNGIGYSFLYWTEVLEYEDMDWSTHDWEILEDIRNGNSFENATK